MNFEQTFKRAMIEEGGGKYHINPVDGQATKWGIASGSGYKKKPIRDITEQDAKAYYLALWTKLGLTRINDDGIAYLVTRRSMYSPAKFSDQLSEAIEDGIGVKTNPRLVKDPKGYYKALSDSQIKVLNSLTPEQAKRFKQFYISFTKSKLNKKVASNIARKWIVSLKEGFNDVGVYVA